MYRKRLFGTLLVGLLTLLFGAVLPMVIAQSDSAASLTLLSPDPSQSVLFQPLVPGGAPISTMFRTQLVLAVDRELETTLIYVAVENTGWSSGSIGLVSDALDPDARYVALEVGADGTPLAGGLAFELVYDAEIGESGGFVLPMLISQMRNFAVFRVVESDGLTFVGQTNVRDGVLVMQETVDVMIDPEPVFAPFVLECHIVSRPIPVAEPEPAVEDTVSGTWGACGSCDSCGFLGEECVLSPDGACLWNPAECHSDVGIEGDIFSPGPTSFPTDEPPPGIID